MNWIIENKEWIFSGIGITIIGIICKFFFRNNNNGSKGQNISSGDNSTNIQAGKNVHIKDLKNGEGNKKNE